MAVPATLSSVPDVSPYIQYVATAGQTVFPYPFPITEDADLVVVINGVTQSTDSTYSVSGVGNSTGGNCTLNTGSNANDIITLYRDIAIERISQIAQNSGFSSTVFNNEFNNFYLIAQQLEAAIALCLQIPNTNSPAPTTTLAKSSYSGKYLAFDANGNPQPTTLPTLYTPASGAVYVGQTAAEASAGVTPVNYLVAPGNINRYGTNTTPGTTNMTTALSNALACNTSVYIPAGTYYIDNLTFPTTSYTVLYGDGVSSQIVQGATGNPVFKWPTTSIAYTNSVIRDLLFVGTAGTNDTIQTAGVGGITLERLYFKDVPINYSSLYLNGAASTYTHDQRVRDIQIYSSTAGVAGIRVGALSADLEIDGWVMNGNFTTTYCLKIDGGAQSTQFSNLHIYNAATNVVYGAAPGSGYNDDFTFDNCTFDNTNGAGDLMVLNGFGYTMITDSFYEATANGYNSITLNNCTETIIDAVRFDGASGSGYCVKETGTTDYTAIGRVSSTAISDFTNPPFYLIGSHSNYPGARTRLSGSTSGTVSANTTVYLGPNGAQSAAIKSFWIIGDAGGANVQGASVWCDTAPGTGQTFTVGLYGNGSLLTAASGSANPLVLSGASAQSGTIQIAAGSAAFLAQFATLELRLVTSSSANTPNVGYTIDYVRNALPS